MKKNLFIDIDGVLVDFVASTLELFDKPNYIVKTWTYYEDWGLTANEFWDRVNLTPTFWENLNPYIWTPELLYFIDGKFNYFLLSSPANHHLAYSGRVKWIHKYFGNHFKNFLLGDPKYLLSNNRAILLDDNDDNCQAFIENGGSSIVFPQLWNSAKNYIPCRIEFVKNRLQAEY